MLLMRDLGDDFKLSFRSIAEVYEIFGAMVARTATDKKIRFVGKKPTRAAVVNALILWADSLPPEKQREAIKGGMERLNELLAREDGGSEQFASDGSRSAEAPVPGQEKHRGRRKGG